MGPDIVAAALLRKLPKNPFVITANFDSRLAHLLIRLAPWIAERAMRRADSASPGGRPRSS